MSTHSIRKKIGLYQYNFWTYSLHPGCPGTITATEDSLHDLSSLTWQRALAIIRVQPTADNFDPR